MLGGAIKELAISGAPVIPREVTLSKGTALTGWSSEFYYESDYKTASTNALQRAQIYSETAQQATGWRYESDEIAAVGSPEFKDCLAESLLRYNRPLEVGDEISLEFFYDAGKTELSPAVGRTAFLLKPDGLMTHQLTNMPYSSVGPPIDNESPAAGAKPISLKPGQWHQLKLVIEADQVKLSVNGEEIGAAPRDKSDADLFGFFRRKNEIGAKVKNVILKGKSPGELPKG